METTDDENFESFFRDVPYLEFECNSEDCPPPLFSLPPPPRPPWLEDLEPCQDSSASESCDNILIIDSQVHLQETFQNLIIIAVCAAILVILIVFLVACIWRLRKSRGSGCDCGDSKPDSSKQVIEMSERVTSREVYDNPNYSHIMIGGQPFFILPSGELSEHVPVPPAGETLTPRNVAETISITPRNVTEPFSSQHHIYEGGSSTYRSTSDYDTDSSNFRPESDRASDSFPPIYEEIDKCSSVRVHSLSPRGRTVSRPPPNNSMYYYSDTLKRRPARDIEERQESDSGLSSRSGQNTSSESTPRHRAILNTSARRTRNAQPDRVNTQVNLKISKRRDPVVHL